MGMVALKCPGCGADIELDNSREFGFCNFCGTKVMQDKIVVEHQGEITIDNSKKTDNLYQLARRARSANDSETAAKYYNLALVENPDDWEAQFFSTFYDALNCKIYQISSAASRIQNNALNVLGMISNSSDSLKEKEKHLTELSEYSIMAGQLLYFNSKSTYEENKTASNAWSEFVDRFTASLQMVTVIGFSIDTIFSNELTLARTSTICLKGSNQMTKEYATYAHSLFPSYDPSNERSIVDNNTVTIIKYDTTYTPPILPSVTKASTTNSSSGNSSSGGGCYVATAVYGSYDCPEVWTLRRFRDHSLALTWYGRLFITLYYAISPTIVKWFGHTRWFNKMWKGKLDRMVNKLNNEGVENTPYDDIDW